LDFLEFSKYKGAFSAIRNSSTSFFPIWMPFLSFSFLVVLAKTSRTILKRYRKSGHHYVVPDLRGKQSVF